MLYSIVSAQYGDRQYTVEGKQEMTATLAKMECEYIMSGISGCARPQFFYNCCDLPRDGNSYSDYPDIDVTYQQLLDWAPTECMKEQRKAMFGWAAEFGSLYRLCRGDYDTFCDNDFLQGSYGDTCITLDQYNSDPAYGGNGGGSYSDTNQDTDSYNNAGSSYAKSGGLSIDQNPVKGDNTARFNELEAMILNAVINGVIFSMVIVLFMTIYVCYSRYYHKQYEKVKYNDNDVEN